MGGCLSDETKTKDENVSMKKDSNGLMEYPELENGSAHAAVGSEKLNQFISPKMEATQGTDIPSLRRVAHSNAISDLAEANLSFYQMDKTFKSPNNGFQGPFEFMDASTYKGNFKNGLREGLGESVYLDGSCYQGNWKNGMKNGKGVFAFADGDIFVGDFVDDSATGFGTYYYSDGSKYVGNFERNMMQGAGEIIE